MAKDEFLARLGGDVRIPAVARSGPLSIGEVLASAEWFSRERLQRTQPQPAPALTPTLTPTDETDAT